MPRLYIGSHIIDSADTSSSSTQSGAQLDPLDLEGSMAPQIVGGEYRWPIMYCVVTAASESALKTAVDAVVAAIRNCQGKTIKYEETNGTTLFEMNSNEWPQAEAEVTIDQAQLTADIAFSFRGFQSGAVSGGAADEAGQTSPITWQYEITGGGIAGMVAQASFGPTISSGSITAGARENAVAWITKLRTTTNYPSWLDTTFRQVSAVIEFDQKQNLASIAESSYDPALVTITFRELPATLAANSAFTSDVQSVNVGVSMRQRPPLSSRAGALPGFDLIVSGDFILKTEGSDNFISTESSLADNAIYAKAAAVVAGIETYFQTVYGAGLGLVRYGKPELNIDPVQGFCTYAIAFTGDVTIFEWDERVELRNIEQKAWSRATKGKDWEYEQEGGPLRILRHYLKVVATVAVSFRNPQLGNNWSRVEAGSEPNTELKFSDGALQWVTVGERIWRYVNPSDGNNGAGATSAGSFTLDNVGQGVI